MSPLLLQEPPATRDLRLTKRAAPATRFFGRTDVRLGIVLVICLIPRAIAAWRLPAVCDDAYYYLHVADSLQRGRVARALEYLNINVYPLVLMALYRLGLDWIVAAKLWGVVMGTAIVLPLFDWLRRMFSERIAMVGVFLYAVHPRIVEPTVEPLREATFWFFFVLCLDLFWRAAGERRWWQFAAAGFSLALALHTRMEAWFLLVPLGAWMATAWWRNPAARGRLASGTLLSLAATPLFILLVNVTLLSHHYQWELGRLTPFLLVSNWVRTPVGNEAIPGLTPKETAASSAPRSGPSLPHAESTAKTAGGAAAAGFLATSRQYFREMARTLGVVFLSLTLIGFVRGRRELLEPNRAVLLLMTAAVLLAIWVRVSEIGNLNGRYFLILVFIDAPFAALGAHAVVRWLQRLGLDRGVAWLRPPRRAATLFAACVLFAGWTEALLAHHTHRDTQARLGNWIAGRAGQFESVVADFNSVRPAYAAGRKMPDVVTFDEFFDLRLDRYPPDLAIFYPAGFREELLPDLVRRAARHGLTPLDQAAFSRAKPEFVVFVRNRR